jgi:hypothetical protein
MSPDIVAQVVVSLLAGERSFETGSALRLAADTVELLAVEPAS